MGCANYGMLQKQNKNIEVARTYFKKSCDENDYAGCGDLGLLLSEEGKNEQARPLFEKACTGGEAQACNNLGVVLDESKDEILYCGSAQDLVSGFIGWVEEEKWISKRLKKKIFIKCLIFGGTDAEKLREKGFNANYFKKEENVKGDNDPIGLILTAEKHDVTVEYALGGISNKLFVSKYQLYLPKKEELAMEIRKLLK